MSHLVVLVVLAFAGSALIGQEGAAATSFDLAGDWNFGANPNGQWSYQHGSALLGTIGSWGPGFGHPAYANAASGPGHIPACLKLASLPSGAWDLALGDVILHSWDAINGPPNGEANIVWTAPTTGTLSMIGSVWITRDIGRSVIWQMYHNATFINGGNVFSGDSWSRANPQAFVTNGGSSAVENIAVTAGDTFKFLAVTQGASPGGDLIGINWVITYGATVATRTHVGIPCGNTYLPFLLAMNTPVIGAPFNLQISQGSPNTAGAIYYSAIPGAPLGIGGGCTVYLDLASAAVLFPVATNGSGAWAITVTLPFSPPLAGIGLAMQGVLAPTNGQLGFDLTRGVNLVLGY